MKQKEMFFLELSCFFDDPADVGNLLSGSSAFSKTSLNIRKFSIYILLKPGLENFDHYFTSVWDECNCAVVWTFFGVALLWDWNENRPFPVLWPFLSSKFAGILSAAVSQHHLSGFEIAQLVFHHIQVLIPLSCIMSRTSIHSSPGTLSIRSSPLNLSLTSIV